MAVSKIMLPVRGKIALIDDDFDIIKVVISIIEKKFDNRCLTIVAAPDGQSGIELVNRERPDLVLLDVNMPDKTGTNVLSALRASNDSRVANVHVIMLTARRDSGTVLQAIRLGANEYLAKPFKPAELVERLVKFFSEKADKPPPPPRRRRRK